jgi:hypothetical protein
VWLSRDEGGDNMTDKHTYHDECEKQIREIVSAISNIGNRPDLSGAIEQMVFSLIYMVKSAHAAGRKAALPSFNDFRKAELEKRKGQAVMDAYWAYDYLSSRMKEASGQKSALPSDDEVDAKIKEWGFPLSKSDWICGNGGIHNLLGYEAADYIRETVEWIASMKETK